jgi:polysaccharide biosynthesis/export protein
MALVDHGRRGWLARLRSGCALAPPAARRPAAIQAATAALVRAWGLLAVAMLVVAGSCGCRNLVARPGPRLLGPQIPPPYGEAVPTEKEKTTLPTYTIEPPDILAIEILRLVPKPPYRIQTTDLIGVEIGGILEPTRYFVDPDGRIDLGPTYAPKNKIRVAGLTTDEAAEVIAAVVSEQYDEPRVSVSVVQAGALQPVSGEHLVSPDGTVNLGNYGLVYVAGLTLEEARAAIVAQLEKTLERPQVAVSVFAYNSKVYYVLTQGAGLGDVLMRFPITGNETVLDAIAQVNGLSRLSSKQIWIARPAPSGVGCDVILPVDWNEITAGGGTATNYQVLPGDRIFIAENKLIAFDAALNKVIAPFERLFGFTLLGTQTIQTINRFPQGLNTNSGF